MTLKLYNTRTRRKQVFEPIDAEAVRMYVCGPTVYDFAHIGNARPIIVFDVLFRLLRHLYGPDHVIYARNITDVDDKINARAAEEGISIRELTERTTAQFHEDIRALGVLTPEDVNEPGKPPRFIEPRATDYVSKPDAPADMIRIIARLIERGHAYEAEGHVLFSVATDPQYGKLARRSVDEMRAGARVEVAPYKRDPMDFVLWKPSTASEPGWDSPWGFGRPGWHLECSAMSAALLGEVFDIHGGGIDLLFPHHENELAQSTCAFGTNIMANIWMHNGHLQVEGAKMSKSLGNFVTIHELVHGWKGLPWAGAVIKWAMLQTHYRQPMNWTLEGLFEARNEMDKMALSWWQMDAELREEGKTLVESVNNNFQVSPEVLNALKDDLNTSDAITHIRERSSGTKEDALQNIRDLSFIGIINENASYIFTSANTFSGSPRSRIKAASDVLANMRVALANEDTSYQEQLEEQLRSLNFVLTCREPYFLSASYKGEAGDTVDDAVRARLEARKAKNWAEADRIRDELAAMGIALKDAKNPVTGEIETTWEIAR